MEIDRSTIIAQMRDKLVAHSTPPLEAMTCASIAWDMFVSAIRSMSEEQEKISESSMLRGKAAALAFELLSGYIIEWSSRVVADGMSSDGRTVQ